MATQMSLDRISRIPPRVEPAPRPQFRLPILRRKQRYTGAVIYRLSEDIYEAEIGQEVWRLERARVEIRMTGRRVRQKARYLIGRMKGILSVVFLEFVELTRQIDQVEALHYWLDQLSARLSSKYLADVFEVVEYVASSRHQSVQIVPA